MIFFSFLLFALTILVIFYPIIRSKSDQQEVTLQDIYTKNYLATEHRLDTGLKNGTLTQEEYDSQKTEAARDLLKIGQKNSTSISKPARLIVVLISMLFPVLAIGTFWTLSYTPETRQYDSERSRLMAEFTEWRETLPMSELDSFNSVLMIEPQPRNPNIFNELKYGFPALFLMSAKETHDHIPTLKLLGKLLYDVKWLPVSHEVYSRVIELSPNDYIANAMVIDIELQNSNNQLTPKLIKKIEDFLRKNPKDTSLRVMYAQTLYDNQMIPQSIAQWTLLRDIFKENMTAETAEQAQQTIQAIDMIITAINQQTMETAQVRNYVIDLKTFDSLDWQSLSEPSILTVYLFDQEDSTPLAYKELLITDASGIPSNISLNDFDRFADVKQPIRSYEHLTIFGTISNIETDEIIYATHLAEIPKGAYESALMFEPIAEVNNFSKMELNIIELAKAEQSQRFLLQVNLPNVDLDSLPDNATLNLFISPAGSRMPLAAKKIPSAKNLTFPLTVEITDENKLMQGTPSLFSYENLEIGGRLSMSNEAVGQAGDIESSKQTVSPAKANILILDQIRDSSKMSPMAQ